MYQEERGAWPGFDLEIYQINVECEPKVHFKVIPFKNILKNIQTLDLTKPVIETGPPGKNEYRQL